MPLRRRPISSPCWKKQTFSRLVPGLGRSAWARALFEVVAADSRPAVWDADALNLLAESPDRAELRIITPHPGETGVLLGRSTADVQSDRVAAVRAMQERFAGVAVLKGAGTLIAAGPETPSICTSGNPAWRRRGWVMC